MNAVLLTLLSLLVLARGSTFGGEADSGPPDYVIRSLNAPNATFTAAASVPIEITAKSTARIRRAVVRLNDRDVTSAFTFTERGVKTGTVTGLLPGINTFELFSSSRARHPKATLKVALRLPDAWNRKFYMPGGAGTDGGVPGTTSRLAQGYAAAASDSGHSNAVNSDPLAGGSASFGTDDQARVDFAYNAIDVTTRTAKRLV